MKVAVYGRVVKDIYKDVLIDFFRILKVKKIEIYTYQPFFEHLRDNHGINVHGQASFRDASSLPLDADMLFSIGGDGTILDAVSMVRDKGIPIVGINLGKLGFLANIATDELPVAMDMLIGGDYTIQERKLLKLETPGFFNDFPYGLNDFTIQKKSSEMITVKTFLDGEYLNTYWADGLIIATPTGSTAYSLSVGGPIVVPTSGNFTISPISAHNLTVRPVVVPDSTTVKLQVEGNQNFFVSLDHRVQQMKGKIEILLKKSEFAVKLVQLENAGYYKTLRNKLMWGFDKRN